LCANVCFYIYLNIITRSHQVINFSFTVEFYFADSNLPYDKFMWQLHTANDEHWVPLKTVTSFKRMREHLVDRELSWVADAIRVRSSALEVDEKGDNVRRTTEVTEPKGQFQRSVYAVCAKDCRMAW
jgi:lupus La protein